LAFFQFNVCGKDLTVTADSTASTVAY
jgi:hypothetical protein